MAGLSLRDGGGESSIIREGLQQKEPTEVVQAPDNDVSWRPTRRGIMDMSYNASHCFSPFNLLLILCNCLVISVVKLSVLTCEAMRSDSLSNPGLSDKTEKSRTWSAGSFTQRYCHFMENWLCSLIMALFYILCVVFCFLIYSSLLLFCIRLTHHSFVILMRRQWGGEIHPSSSPTFTGQTVSRKTVIYFHYPRTPQQTEVITDCVRPLKSSFVKIDTLMMSAVV